MASHPIPDLNRDHPASKLFPMIGSAELQELADDIKANGLRDPIALFDGMVLDGRNRMAACRLAKVEPIFHVVETDSPFTYVISTNLRRRQLSTSQRAAIAAEALPMLQEEAKKRQGRRNDLTSSPIGAEVVSRETATFTGGTSRALAAKAFQVGSSSIDRALEVKKSDPILLEKVKAGEMTVTAAQQHVREGRPEKPGPAPVTPFEIRTVRHRQLADAQYKRMTTALDGIHTYSQSLEERDLAMVRAVCGEAEISDWVSSISESVALLKKFARLLQGGV
jgi:ParB-like chromosome segregation protein Spo0J